MQNVGKKVTSGVFWNYAERLLAQCVSLLVTIILARLIAPEEYGAIAVCTVLITLLNVFVSSGFGNALIQAKEAPTGMFNSMFVLSFLLALCLYGVVFVLAPVIASIYSMPILVPVIRVMTLRIPIASINTIQHSYLVRQLEFKKFFVSTLLGTVISAITGIIAAYCGLGIWALVIQYLTNVSIDTFVLFFTSGWRFGFDFDWQGSKAMLPFGLRVLLSEFLINIYDELNELIIGKKISVADLAYYSKGKQFPSIVVTNLNASISRVLFSAMSKYQSQLEQIRFMTRRALKVNLFIVCPLMVGMAMCSRTLIIVLLTDKWLESTLFLQIFCLTFLLKSVRSIFTQSFNALGKSGITLVTQVACCATGLALLFVSAFILRNRIMIALSTAVVQIIACVISSVYANKEFAYEYTDQMKDCCPILIAAAAMGVGVWAIDLIPLGSSGVTLLVQVLVGILIYVVFSALLRIDSLAYCLNLIGKYLKKRN